MTPPNRTKGYSNRTIIIERILLYFLVINHGRVFQMTTIYHRQCSHSLQPSYGSLGLALVVDCLLVTLYCKFNYTTLTHKDPAVLPVSLVNDSQNTLLLRFALRSSGWEFKVVTTQTLSEHRYSPYVHCNSALVASGEVLTLFFTYGLDIVPIKTFASNSGTNYY